MKNLFQNIVFTSIYITCDEFSKNYQTDINQFAEEHPHAGQKIYNTILRQSYKNAALNIEGVLLARAIREALTKDETVKLEICDKIKANTAIQIEAILERINKIDSGDGESLSKPKNKPKVIAVQPLPDEREEFPEYCKLTALFAQGYISKKNNAYQLSDENAAAPRLFSNAVKLASHIKKKYLANYSESGLAQIIRDTLEEDDPGDMSLYLRDQWLSTTGLYCEANNLETTDKFNRALDAAVKRNEKK